MDWHGRAVLLGFGCVALFHTAAGHYVLSLPRVLLLLGIVVGQWKSKEKNSVAHFISLNLRIIIQRGLGLCWWMMVVAVE